MYKFYILKTNYWNKDHEILEIFRTKDIKKGMKKVLKKTQKYINNGTVNDYTTFSSAYMQYNSKIYDVYKTFSKKDIQLRLSKYYKTL